MSKGVFLSQSTNEFADENTGALVSLVQYNFIPLNDKGERLLPKAEFTRAVISGLLPGKEYDFLYRENDKTHKKSLVGALPA
jgi:hypothetical protein